MTAFGLSSANAQNPAVDTQYWLGSAGSCGSIYSFAYEQDCSGPIVNEQGYESQADPLLWQDGPTLELDTHGGTWEVRRSASEVIAAFGPDSPWPASSAELNTITIPGGATSFWMKVNQRPGTSSTGESAIRLKLGGALVHEWVSNNASGSPLFPLNNNSSTGFVATVQGIQFDTIELSATGNSVLKVINGSAFYLGGVDPNASSGGGGRGTPQECLENGGFELPLIGANTFRQEAISNVPGWNSVRYGRMEFIPYWYGAHPEGVQAIELNSDGGLETIYQDFNTTPGSTIDFSFFHHNNPSNIIDQVDVRFGAPGGTMSAGVFSTVGNGWTQQNGSYVVPTGQTVTRMEIVSLNPAGNGNLLDGVSAMSTGCGSAPVADTDGDGTPDDEDAFPDDPNEDTDTDGDGVGDNADAFPNDPTRTMSEKLVLHLQADGDVADASGEGNNGVFTGAQYAPGVSGQAFRFNGQETYVTVPNSASLQSGNVTVAYWVNYDLPQNPVLVTRRGNTNTSTWGWQTGVTSFDPQAVNATQEIQWCWDNLCEYSPSIPSVNMVDTWTHVTVTYDDSLVRMYLNGTKVREFAASSSFENATADLIVGRAFTANGYSLVGCMDDVRVYNYAISDADVQSLASVQATGLCQPDADGDGIPDDEDAFPNNPSESADSDGDGVGDNSDNAPNTSNPGQEDADGDGVGDVEDAFPNDPTESADTDGDGVGDNADNAPNIPNPGQEDNDSDGVGDVADEDDDNDGVADTEDAFPFDPTEDTDTDGDGVGDNADIFPTDPNESSDADGDGIGDNADPDDDDSGLPDLKESVIPMLTSLDRSLCVEDTSGKSKKSGKSDKSKKSGKSSKKSGKSDKGGEDDLAKAIDRIERSLNLDLWTDASHPDSKQGHKIFDEEKKAVKELQDLIEDTEGCDDVFQAAIDALVDTDLMLVDVAIAEAEAGCSGGKCEKDIAKAQEARAEALDYRAEGREDKAIDELKYAWKKVKRYASDTSNSMQVEQLFDAAAITDLQTQELPDRFELTGNYPNPFNPQTSITFSMPEAAHVRLTVYDVLGRRVALLVDGSLSAGKHEVRFDATNLPSGQYLYRLTTPKGEFTKMMMLLK